MRKFIIGFVVYVAIFMIVGVGESYGQRVVSSDSRRTIYSGNVSGHDVYELPMWTGQSSLDGFSKTTAGELGWDTQYVWNEAGVRAMTTQLKSSAVIWVLNGEANPIEGYLAGCTKNGKPFWNRVRLQKIGIVKTAAKTEVICQNGALNQQTGRCEVNGELDLVCPDPNTRLNQQNGKCEMIGQSAIICDKPGYIYNDQLGKCTMTAASVDCPSGKLWDFEKNKCVSKGVSKWTTIALVGAGVGGGYLLGKYLHKCKSTCNHRPVKTTPSNPTQGPVRPRRTFFSSNSFAGTTSVTPTKPQLGPCEQEMNINGKIRIEKVC